MVAFYGWGSTTQLQSHYEETVYFFTITFPEIPDTHSKSCVKVQKIGLTNLCATWLWYLTSCLCYVTVIVHRCYFSRIVSHLILPDLKGYLSYKILFAIKQPLMSNYFFIWIKNVLFSRYLNFCVLVKSTDFKICDVTIGIAT